jgi:hypothetical protein
VLDCINTGFIPGGTVDELPLPAKSGDACQRIFGWDDEILGTRNR